MVNDKVRLVLIIVISVVLFILIILAIIFIVKWYKKRQNKKKLTSSVNSTKSSPSVENPFSRIRISNDIDNTNKRIIVKKDYLSKEMKINAYCECFLKPVKFSLINTFNDSCPIDLIPFQENEEVSVTKCFHAFHYNCIKKYLLENENNKEFKCPFCLTVLLEMDFKL